MNKALKYTTALGTVAAAFVLTVGVASADSGIVNSGNNANVNTSTTQNTLVNVSNSNSAVVSQSSFSVSNSGGNSTSGNIGGGAISTGAAATSTNLGVQANQNQTAVNLPASVAAGNSAEVVNTGNNLDLNNSTTKNTAVTVANTNQFAGQQQAISLSNSGLNGTDGNIGGGSIATGAASSATKFGVEANVSQTAVNLAHLASMGGTNDLMFTNTGNGANVDNSNTVNTVLGVANVNSALVSQSSFGLANSGLNFTDGNIWGGNIASGTAGVGNEFSVMANKNTTGLAFGSSAGSAGDLEVTNTGNNLDLNGATTVNTVVSATSTNTSATAQTSVDVSNSGLNFGSSNIGGGSTGSGNAGVWTGFMSGGNWNQTLIN